MKPPFRADQVGSLLRPPKLAAARLQFKEHAISADELKQIENDCVRAVVERQEAIGLCSITDGELRRAYWHIDFLQELDGVSIVAMPNQNRFGGTEEQPPMATVTGKIGCSAPIMTDAFDYLKGLTTKTAKVTIPSPSMLYMRGGRNAVSSAIYPDPAEFWEDVALAYQRAIRFLADRGCTYLQLDDVSFAYLCDPKFREGCRRNGDDPDLLPRTYADAINAALRRRPYIETVAELTRARLERQRRAFHNYVRTSVLGHFINYRIDAATDALADPPIASRAAQMFVAHHDLLRHIDHFLRTHSGIQT